ncbi:uncharacterized protein LOC123531415 [Mercenaria mercenaria]|uniref:uncharacterized protein LOC123531415 n=1 Tax=Mercenaria mercenaria TaxID=6596 RepID=UPI00234E90EE|nr:uncharacterized protein LOC123531415 [Mercenaria mercenaria]XP_053388837.1 uncharacterized protein LOC123531415 [Mercenaria mercenaria]
MMSAEQKVKQIHTSLLTSISDTMVETDKEYENFIIHMGVYVERGLIMQHKTFLGKLSTLEKKAFLGPGNYKFLKEICIKSGNNYLIDYIETAEKEIMKVRKEYGEGALSGSKQLKGVDESLDTDDATEEESTHIEASNLHIEQRYQDSTPRKRPTSDLSDLAHSGSKQARNEYETQKAEGRCYHTNKDVSTTIEPIDVQAQQRMRQSVHRKRRSSDSPLLDTFNSPTEKQQYNNWVYAGLLLKCVLQVLSPFCNDIVNKQHRVILNNVKRKHNIKNIECGGCILWNLQPDHVRTKRTHCPFGQSRCNCMFPRDKIPCPNYVCGAIYDEIIKLHTPQTPGPYWENTDIQKWCTDPWSIAKCFISHASKSISDTDISGILQLIGNNIEFHNHITEMNRITKLRQWRNAVAHSPTMELDDKQLDILFEDITTLLENEQELKTRQETEDVMKILQALKENPFEINTKAETEAVSDALVYTRQSIEDICQRIEDLQEYLTNKTATNKDRSCSEQPYASRRFESLETRVRQLEREMEGLKQAEIKQLTNAEAILDKRLPRELKTDPFTRQLYNKALQNDSSKEKSIKVMVIGCYKHGKTSLVRRLLGQKLDDRAPTNGIEVHRCIAKPNGEWKEVKTEESERKFFRQLSKQTPETEDHESTPHKILPNQETSTKSRKEKCVHDYDREYSLSASDASATKQSENIFQKFKNEFQMSFDTKGNLNDIIDLSILDLSGKFTYYATHQILLSTRAVYILVINLKDDLNEILTYTDNPGETHTKSLREYISFWVNSIHTFVGTEDGYFPPIFLVGTHKDEIDIDDSKVFSEIRKMFKNNPALNHLQMKTFSVSNTNTELSKADFISVRSLIIEVGKQQPMTYF